MKVLAIDVGGTAIKSALVCDNGELIDFRELPTPAVIAEGILEAAGGYSGYAAVGISTAGLVDYKQGVVIFSSAALGYRDNEPLAEEIGFDQFMAIDLRAAKILTCEPVKKSKKLLKMTVDLGFEERQVVSGIAAWYKPEDLIGKTVAFVANLKPAKLCGVESQGMILAADGADDSAQVLFLPAGTEPGDKIR